ncbi:MAG TPA: hypothetical protein VHQ97_06720 [Solirubrobacterales bacterium]|nr:hypothetical protein [Solirubrobacterales bacterium]
MSSPDVLAVPVDDANDLRGAYFGLLIRRPLTLALLVGFAIAGGVAGAALGGPPAGAIGLGAAFVIGLLVVFGIADSRSEDAFFQEYGTARGMSVEAGRRHLSEGTPLLTKGDDRYATRLLEGPLGEGVTGLLALYTYEEESSDGDGNETTNSYRYTVGIAEVPECLYLAPELYCRRKFGFRALEGLEDVFRSKKRVEFESEKLTERYEIFANPDLQDYNWLRQLFSPSFIVWLAESAPDGFAFELTGGHLCCYVSGHKSDAAHLDAMRAATAAVATRLREESTE